MFRVFVFLWVVLFPCMSTLAQDGTDEQGIVLVADDTTQNLIGEIEEISASSGSKPDRNRPVELRSRPEQVANELKRRYYSSDQVTKADEEAFIRVARKEPASVLTDPTSVRGNLYRYVLNAMLEQDRLSYEDERWVRSVHQLSVQHRESWFKNESAYAEVEVRRLARSGEWKIRINQRVFVPHGRMGEDYFRKLRPEGLAVNGWWDGLIEVHTPMGWNNSLHWDGEPPTTFARTIKGMIYEGDPYADIWWPVAKVEHPIEFKIASWSLTDNDKGFDNPDARFESVDGSQVIEDQQEYVDWLERNMEVRMERKGTSFWIEGMPDSFCLTLKEGAQKSVKLPAFTFGGRASLFVVIGTPNSEGEMIEARPIMLRECDGVWWALRDEPDMYGGRKIEHKWHLAPWTKRHGYSFEPQLNDNQKIVRGYVEIRMGSNIFGHQDMRAVADPAQQRLLTETVRLPVDSSNLVRIEAVCRSALFSSLRKGE